MSYDVSPILKDAEAELADLLKDQQQLSELHSKYAAEHDAAEQAWKQKHSATQLDKMQQAKAYRDTVAEALREQAHEVAKAGGYVAQLREQLRQQGVLAGIAEDAARLAELQAAHTRGVLELGALVHREVLRLLAVRDEWRQRHTDAWDKVQSLGVSQAERISAVEQAGIDLVALRTAAPAEGVGLAPHQKGYIFPEHPDADLRSTTRALIRTIMQPEHERSEAAMLAHRVSRRSTLSYQDEDDWQPDLGRLTVRAQPQPSADDEDGYEDTGRVVVPAGQTVTAQPLDGGGEW